MPDYIVLLLAGKRRSGKTKVAQYLGKYGYVTMGFADLLYDIYNQVWFDCPSIYDTHGDLSAVERKRLINLGGAIRFVNKDAFVRVLAGRARKLWKFNGSPCRIVVPNYRFPNEARLPEYLGGEVMLRTVHIERIGYTPNDGLDGDITETALDNADFDYTISVDDGDLAALAGEAVRVHHEVEKEVKNAGN